MQHQIRILVLAVVLATFAGALPGGAGPAGPQPVRAASTVEICGSVSVYVAPTALLSGALTIGLVPFVIKSGTDVPASVKVGAYLCLRLTVNASGSITDIVALDASANVIVKICGEVTAYAKASLTKLGSLTIGGRKFVLAYGAELPAAVKVGADLCASLELNAFGQVKDGTVTATATAILEICGEVTAYAEASLTKLGSLTISGRKFALAYGAELPATVKVGADLCASLELNAFGQVNDGTVTANATSVLQVCGEVTAYAKASATSDGILTVGGVKKAIAAGTSLPTSVALGAFVKLRLEVDVFGRISKAVVVAVGANLSICSSAVPPSSPSPTPTARPTPTASPPPSSPSPTPTARPTPTASPTPTARPTPTASPPPSSPSPTPTASLSPAPTSSPSPTPTDGSALPSASPTPSPQATTDPNAPTPVPAAIDHPAATHDPNVCAPAGVDPGSGAAPDLPDTSMAERAGMVIGTAAIPFMLLALGLVMWQFAAGRLRQRLAPEALSAEAGREVLG